LFDTDYATSRETFEALLAKSDGHPLLSEALSS
jgi:hypothetical protein